KIVRGDITSHSTNLSMILADTYSAVFYASDYVVGDIPVVESAFDGNRMRSIKSMHTGKVDIYVTAVLRFKVGTSHFQVTVTEEFTVCWQAVSLFKRKLCLQVLVQIVSGGRPIPH